jgi:lipid A 3-O-deacylase
MKPRSMPFAAVIAFAVIVAAGQARAEATADNPSHRGWFSEIRLGVLAHDQAPIVDNVETGADLNIEVLFRSPRGLRRIGAPRPHAGITLAPEGTSLGYAGLTWERDFRSHWFVSGGFGVAVHDGDPLRESQQTPQEQASEKALDCRAVVHLYVGAGYRFSRRWNVAAHYEHLSNGTLCDSNDGLENIGIRIGRVF